ncbi:MAG: Asp-tRNA(Asn)/Glu-tRNA(Gln) amidotransferase subunit GatA [Parcubacteria group bacterium]
MIDLSTLTIVKARQALTKGEFTARELTEACISATKEKDNDIHAFLEVFDDALTQADEADKKIKEGIDLPLLGIPVAVKDNMLVEGHIASAGSKILEKYRATYSATAVNNLLEAGAIILGRTNMDEFAMGSSTENSAYGITKNPHDLERVAGGSSGGSAAAVAGGMVLASLGSDTGGSIRQPGAFTGVVGMKPTYGRVSRSGLIALASSLDQIGPFTKTAEDAEIIYQVINGRDPKDSTTIEGDAYEENESRKIIGIPREFVEGEGVEPDVKKNFEEAVLKFKSLGYEVKDISLENLKYSLAVYYILMPAEASSNLARFDGVKYGLRELGETGIEDYFKTRGKGFGAETRRRVILGTYVLSSGYYDAYYGSAVSAKALITRELREIFKDIDILLTPTTPTPAFKIGERTENPLSMYLADIFTVPANIAGLPSISLPSGTVLREEKALPVGVLLSADLGQESIMFKASRDYLNENG